jgi:FMN reductase
MNQTSGTKGNPKPLVVGIGGSTREGSSTNRVLALALKAAEAAGARVLAFDGPKLARLPHFTPETSERIAEQIEFLDAVRRADGIIVASPGYHGGISGLVKNALDLLEDLRSDERHYLDGRAVGCVVVAAGCQAAVTTLQALRAIVHALRGWPTPFGAILNSTEPIFDEEGTCTSPKTIEALNIVGRQVVEFARYHSDRP